MRRFLIATFLAAAGPLMAADLPPNCTLSGDDTEIISACTAAIKAADADDEKRARALALRAGALVRKGKIEAALTDYGEAIRLRPKWPPLYALRGIAFAEGKRYADAVRDFDTALAATPNDPNTNYLRGRAHAKLGNNQQALIDLSRAIELKPEDPRPYQQRAIVQTQRGKLDLALQDFDKLLALTPNDVEALNNRCYVRALANTALKEALNDCNKAMELKPQPEIRDSRGLVYLRIGEFDKAIEDFDASLAKRPNAAGTLYKRGIARLRNGDTDGGNADLIAAKSADPKIVGEMAGYGLKP